VGARRRGTILALVALLLAVALLPPGAAVASERAEGWVPPPKRVGLQVGHLRIEELPEDQARLRTQTGGGGGGYREVDVNLAVVERTAAILQQHGIAVDILPAAVPRGYLADLFLSIHCDSVPDTGANGFKLARYRSSAMPAHDDALIAAIRERYAAATGLPWDDNITRGMSGYYAYNQRRYQSVISPDTPAAIIELGFISNPSDRALLIGSQDRIAAALAAGILDYLEVAPSLGARQFAGTGWLYP
jgi:N-acetylmuramoyl-L-alanine amidase